MHLNGLSVPGLISQIISTRIGSTYMLSFLMAANTDCGDAVKALIVNVVPSSLQATIVNFNGSGFTKDNMGWAAKVFTFDAMDEFATVSFQSLTTGGCGPYVDDVRVIPMSSRGDAPADSPVAPPATLSNEMSGKKRRLSGMAVIGIALGVGIAAFLLGICCGALFLFGVRKYTHTTKSKNIRNSIADASAAAVALGATTNGIIKSPKGLVLTEHDGMKALPFGMIDKATNSFGIAMGRCTFGFAYLAEFENGVRGVVKRELRNHRQSDDEFIELVMFICRARHPNIVELVGYCMEQGEHILVFEHFAKGSLYDILHGSSSKKANLSWRNRVLIALDIISGLEYLHHTLHPPIVHGNLKSANILLTEDLKAKVADFGLQLANRVKGFPNQRHSPPSESNYVAGYIDPDREEVYSEKSDVYSFGILLLEIITGLKAIHQNSPLILWAKDKLQHQHKHLGLADPALKGLYQPRQFLAIVAIVKDCVKEDPDSRPSIDEVANRLRKLDNLPDNPISLPHMQDQLIGDSSDSSFSLSAAQFTPSITAAFTAHYSDQQVYDASSSSI